MTYQVLARKWRPRSFPEVAGQAHVIRTLTNALENNRLHHAYLFTGTRGVGKTTLARIIAKSLNCESCVTAQPCGHCVACREIDAGCFPDLIEVDAASRTKVEDTRELLENVPYAPTKGRYKVYLIDEVHMLSTHSFNALLKTLEEPPPHVKFLLATTDPQKLPPTILSRCLQFHLKRLSLTQLAQQLEKIVTEEQVTYDPEALRLLAQAADGSVRDALSLLDQAIAYGNGHLSSIDVNTMLGTLEQGITIELVKKLALQDVPGLLQHITDMADYNPDFFTVLGDILSLLQKIALAQLLPTAIETDSSEGETILQLAQQFSPEDVQLFYQIGLLGRRDLPLAPEARSGFEMILLRMLAFRPVDGVEQPAPPQQPHTATHTNVVDTVSVQSAPVVPATPVTDRVDTDPAAEKAVLPAAISTGDEWTQTIQNLKLSGAVKQLAFHCAFKRREETVWHLSLRHDLKALLNETRREELEKHIQQYYGHTQRLHICVEYPETDTPAMQQQRIRETREQAVSIALEHDPFVAYLKENCATEIKKITLTTALVADQ